MKCRCYSKMKNKRVSKKGNYKKTTKTMKSEKEAHGKVPTILSKHNPSSNWINFLNQSNNAPVVLKVASKAEKEISFKNRSHAKQRKKASKVIALDCEMVADEHGNDMLARVSLVDFNLICIYDKYVKPQARVGDYRTRVSGIRPEDLENGENFEIVQKDVKKLLDNKLIVGHALRHDLQVLQFGHHFKLIRDTSLFKPFRDISDGKTPSLRKLVHHYLGETIQEGEHSSVQDATATMKLYIKYRKIWEKAILEKNVQNLTITSDIKH